MLKERVLSLPRSPLCNSNKREHTSGHSQGVEITFFNSLKER